MKTAQESNSWSRVYDYDAYGNRWIQSANHTLSFATPTAQSQFDAATNRLTKTFDGTRLPADAYDPAGNLAKHAWVGAMAYDANNLQRYYCASATATCTAANANAEYQYDGDGRRVKKLQGTRTTVFVYDAFGNLAAEYDTQPDPSLMAGTYYRTTDHLGSTRLVTDAAGAVVSRRDFFPFGEQIDDTWGNRQAVKDGNTFTTYNREFGVHQKFTGKERDEESGLDYFGARFFSSPIARFTSPDVPFADQHANDPQSWNLYTYVRNQPLRLIDPNGQCTAPAVQDGETGICVDLYIATRTIGFIGKGDNRGPAPNDPDATYRAEIQLAVDPSTGSVRKVKDDPGYSEILVNVDEFGNEGTLPLKGESNTTVSPVSRDAEGNSHFSVYNEATNGWAFLPGALKDSIQTDLKFVVTSTGQVGFDEGGSRTAYPSLEVYRYDSKGNPVTIYQKKESGNPGDLCCRNQPIPRVRPR